jgi:hypothetical protein
MLKTHYILTAALAGATLACGGNRVQSMPEASGPEGYATVRVENQNIRDMKIYVRPGTGASRFRLGTANGMETTMLKIPRTWVTGITELTFEISPIAGSGSAFSEKITANPGEEIVLRIGP